MKNIIVAILSISGLALLINCGSGLDDIREPVTQSERILRFSGIDWIVRNNDQNTQGPGPNYFSSSEDNVWIDPQGKLHLKITQSGGNWYCAELYAKASMGHGTYTFYVNSDVSKLDPHAVFGMFTYLSDTQEIDIEFSKWSDPTNQNAQFAVQPSDIAGNKYRFDIPQQIGPSKHSFTWQAHQIKFESSENKKYATEPLASWHYSGRSIPEPSNEKLRLNLWLYKGQIPSDNKEQEIVIDSVSFHG